MAAQHKFRNSKSVGRLAIAALTLAALSYTINGPTLGCAVLDHTAWFAVDILRLLILRADWPTLGHYLCRGSYLVQHFLQFTTCP